MLGAALPRGTGQKKGVFEGLPGLDGPPKMLEGEVGSKTHTEELLPAVFLRILWGRTGHQVNLWKLGRDPADQRFSNVQPRETNRAELFKRGNGLRTTWIYRLGLINNLSFMLIN